MVTIPDAEARRRLAAAIAAAEAQTTGEIRCVIQTRPQRHADWILAMAAIVGLGLPWALTMLGFGPERWAALAGMRSGQLSVRTLIDLNMAAQLLLFAGVAALGWFSPLGRWLVPRSVRQAALHRHAVEQFLRLGMQRTAGRSAILLIVDVPDRVVEVLADQGIYAKVPPDHWAETVAAVLDGVRNDRLDHGLEQAIAAAGGVLARHFPAPHGRPNELPDRIVLL